MKTRYGLRIRLAFGYICWSVVLAILIGFLAYYVLVNRLESQLDGRVLAASQVVLGKIRPAAGVTDVKTAADPALHDSVPYAFALFDKAGTPVVNFADPALAAVGFTAGAQQAVAAGQPVWETADLSGRHLRLLEAPFTDAAGNVYVIRLAASRAAIDEVRTQFALVLTWLLLFVAVAGAISAWLVLRHALAPVRQISMLAQRITASNLPEFLPVRGSGDELDQVSAAFNSIIAEMHVASQRMWQYLSNISHELRTPLAALRAETEVALRWARTEEEYRRVLSSNIEELDRITKTLADMLDMARAEAGQIELKRSPENLTELANAAVSAMEALGAQRGVKLEVLHSDKVIADIAYEQVLRVLLILIDNAIKYSYGSGKVSVVVKQRAEWAVISVMDKGRGISADDLPHIFERFYRSQSGRTHEIEGSGLGLTQADWIVKTHGGKIEVESIVGRGTRFNVWLPLQAPVAVPSEVH